MIILSLIMFLVGILIYGYAIYKIDSDERGTVITFGAFLLILIWLPISYIPVYIWGLKYETGKGEHVGYVTAVERYGLIYKTNRVYVKTDTQSSQEDDYCVIDKDVYSKLEELSKSKEKVSLKYFSWFDPGIKNCGNESDIIYEVEIIK